MHKLTFIDDTRIEHKFAEVLIRLKKLPILLTCHSDPVEACKYLEELPAEEFPQAIVVDLNMPKMTGFEFADYFGEKLATKYPSTNLYMISSSIRPTDKEMASQHPQIKDFLEKPISKEMLESLFEAA